MQRAFVLASLVFTSVSTIAAHEAGTRPEVASSPVISGQSHSIPKLELRMAWIRPGSFLMGSPATERHRERDERQHRVTLSRGFWLGTCEVTVDQWETFSKESGYKSEAERGDGISQWIRGQWKRVPGSSWKKPGFEQTGKHPVVGISWNDAMKFCEWLTAQERIAGHLTSRLRYTLPTEAQWEYAGRAGHDGPYFPEVKSLKDEIWYRFGDGIGGILAEANTQPTGTRRVNAWGLYDVHGNVFEWCSDWYASELEDNAVDPLGAAKGDERVCRGGAWSSYGKCVRSALRGRDYPDSRGSNLGFRICLSESR